MGCLLQKIMNGLKEIFQKYIKSINFGVLEKESKGRIDKVALYLI